MKSVAKKSFAVFVAVLLLTALLPMSVLAKPDQSYGHIDVRVAGTLTVTTKINGVVQGTPQTLNVTVTSASASVNGTTYQLGRKMGVGKENEWHKDIRGLSLDDAIVITYTISYSVNNVPKSSTGTLTCTRAMLEAAVQECPQHTGFDFNIAAQDVTNLITHDVIFKTEEGGTINGGTADVAYTGVLNGSAFPAVPTTAPGEAYTFDGWYDESGAKVTTFPETVTRDYVYTARWLVAPTPTPEVTPTPEATPEATPVSTAAPVVNTPQTGHDGNGFALILAVLLLTAAAAGVIVHRMKRNS